MPETTGRKSTGVDLRQPDTIRIGSLSTVNSQIVAKNCRKCSFFKFKKLTLLAHRQSKTTAKLLYNKILRFS